MCEKMIAYLFLVESGKQYCDHAKTKLKNQHKKKNSVKQYSLSWQPVAYVKIIF